MLVFSPCVSHIMCRCNHQYQISCLLCTYHHHTKSCRKSLNCHQLVILHSTKNYLDKSYISFHDLLITTHSFPTWQWEALLLFSCHICVRPVFLPTAENSTVQCWGVQCNNVHKKSIKICQLIIMLKHQKHCHPKSPLASFQDGRCICTINVAEEKQ